MMKPFQFTPSLIAALIFCFSATADEVRTKDGRTLVGPTKVLEKVVIVDTVNGKERVALADVVRIRTDKQLRTELSRLANSSPNDSIHGQLGLARSARDFGLTDEMWTYLDRCIKISEGKQHRPRHMIAFLADLEPEILNHRLRKANTEVKVKELLYRVRPTQSPARIAAIEAILANLEGADKPLHRAARERGKRQQRLSALRAIETRGSTADLHFLFRTSIYERDPSLRRQSAGMVRRAKLQDNAVAYLAQGLTHANPNVRIRTAQAYEMLESNNAVELLIHAGPVAAAASSANGAARGHIAFINQQAYVRDFDVEVAQAAFIADPKIDVLQSGSVLDVSIIGTSTVRTQIVDSYRHALRHLAGRDPGPRTSTWAGWYGKHRKGGIIAASTPLSRRLKVAASGKKGRGRKAPGPAGPGRHSIPAAQPQGRITGTGTTLTGEKVNVTLEPSRPRNLPIPVRRASPSNSGARSRPPAHGIPARGRVAPPIVRRR